MDYCCSPQLLDRFSSFEVLTLDSNGTRLHSFFPLRKKEQTAEHSGGAAHNIERKHGTEREAEEEMENNLVSWEQNLHSIRCPSAVIEFHQSPAFFSPFQMDRKKKVEDRGDFLSPISL